MTRGKKSELFHETKRREHLVRHLERCLESGRYAGDYNKAVSYIAKEKNGVSFIREPAKTGGVICQERGERKA